MRPINTGIFRKIITHMIKGMEILMEAKRSGHLLNAVSLPSQESLPSYHEVHILIADDDPLVMNAHMRQLRKLTNNIVQCADGEKAMNTYREKCKEINLVILDKNMPKMSGLEVIRAIRQFEHESSAINRVVIICNFFPDNG